MDSEMTGIQSTPLSPALGASVYYKLGNDWNRPGEVRPAIIVRVWTPQTVNLLIFLDGDNDKFVGADGWEMVPGHVLWKTSVPYAEDTPDGPGASWNWGKQILEPYEA